MPIAAGVVHVLLPLLERELPVPRGHVSTGMFGAIGYEPIRNCPAVEIRFVGYIEELDWHARLRVAARARNSSRKTGAASADSRTDRL